MRLLVTDVTIADRPGRAGLVADGALLTATGIPLS